MITIPDIDALIDAECHDAYHRWDDGGDRDTSWRSHVWWIEGNKRKLCQMCKVRSPRGGGNYGTCEPCLDGIAAYYEAMGDLGGDEDAELD